MPTTLQLADKKCVPCEGDVACTLPENVTKMLRELPGWKVTSEGKEIEKKWVVKNFVAGMKFLNDVAKVAEAEQHHPDVHLSGYKNVRITLSTHAIGGLSENDFILAAKIEKIPVEAKS